jgi:hypothetical protein
MSGSTLAFIFIPLGAAVALAVWITAVFRAQRRPESSGQGDPLGRQVAGGIFRGGGGRQVMPRRDAPAKAPEPAASAAAPGQDEDAMGEARPGHQDRPGR